MCPYRVSACPCAMNWLKKSVLQDDLFCSTPFFRLNSLRAHESRFLISASRISHAAFRCFGVTCSSFWAISSKTCSFLERTLWRSTEPAEISGAFRSRIKTFMLGAWMPRSTGCLERRLWSGCFAAQSGGFSGCMGEERETGSGVWALAVRFFLAVASISLMRLSWLTSEAPGS